MLVKKIVAVVMVAGILGIAGNAFAQSDNEKPKSKSLVERLDSFGKTIFGGILPEKSKPKAAATVATPPKQQVAMPSKQQVVERPAADKPTATDAPDEQPVTSRAGSILAKSERRSFAEDPTPESTQLTSDNVPAPVRRQTAAAEPEETSKTTPRALHERMSGFRQSPFESSGEQSEPNVSVMRSNTPPERVSDDIAPQKQKALEPDATYPEGRPLIAQRVVSTLRNDASRPAQPINDADEKPLIKVESRPAATNTAGPSEVAADKDKNVLFARKGPILSIETVGPRTITVGRESTYQVQLLNSGEVAADDLVIYVSLPEWAEVAETKPSVGDAQSPAPKTAGTVNWKVGHLGAKSREQLTLNIIPRQSRPFDLAVRWEYKPIASQAMIEVQEPKLSLKLEGPREVFYGKKEIYRLKLSNSGSGNAENVVLVLTPVGTGDNLPASHKIEKLAAGEEKSLEVELTARQAGTLTIQADARADGGIHAELAENVLVHRASLKLDIDGPRVQFVGAVANYVVRVRNSGTAPARNVKLSITLPAGAKYLSGIDGANVDSTGNKLEWHLEAMRPDVEQSFVLKCTLAAAGTGRVRLNAVADDDLVAAADTITQVEAVANLTMDVKDPTGPMPVGEESVYEIRVRNRGTKEARGVEVFAYFSRGIEPTSAEGTPNHLGPGQVVFQPLGSIAAGAEVVLKIRAKAEVAGNHVFRAEARCKPLDTRLVSEATNLYYSDAPAAAQTARSLSPTSSLPSVDETMRTITRPARGEQMQAPVRE